MKIAVIGGGIEGVTIAWLLSSIAKVVLYEKKEHLGDDYGDLRIPSEELHKNSSKSADTSQNGGKNNSKTKQDILVEKGNQFFYPHYHKDIAALLDYLDIYSEPVSFEYLNKSNNSFIVEDFPNGAPQNLSSLNYFRYKSIIRSLARFYRSMQDKYASGDLPTNLSLRQYLSGISLSQLAVEEAIYPIAGMLWNYPSSQIAQMSAKKFMIFMNQSELLNNRIADVIRFIPQGMTRYVSRVLFKGNFDKILGKEVIKIRSRDALLHILDDGRGTRSFDKVILTCNPTKSLQVLDHSISEWRDLFAQTKNVEVPMAIHQDPQIIKQYFANNKSNISSKSWNMKLNSTKDNEYHYNLGRIYNLSQDLIMSLNYQEKPQNAFFISKTSRPGLDPVSQRSSQGLKEIQGRFGIYYCNEMLDYDTSHLTGTISQALKLARLMGVETPF